VNSNTRAALIAVLLCAVARPARADAPAAAPPPPAADDSEVEPKSGLPFVHLQGGTLTGGNFKGKHVAPFALGRTATTVAAYAKCVAEDMCTEPDMESNACNWKKKGREEHPINCVDWSQAAAFCHWLGGRLPAGEEREWAASSGEGREHPWGREPPGKQLCWNGKGNDLGQGIRKSTCPVGAYPAGASKQGVLDLAGNVWEWLGGDFRGGKEMRGGSWYEDGEALYRSTRRESRDAGEQYSTLGFRCVLAPPAH